MSDNPENACLNALWYRNGLRFECARSGRCCSGEPGTISVRESDIAVLSSYLGMPRAEFCEIYIRVLRDGTASLREKFNGDCIFFENESVCTIYDHRPRQCRTWPFWQSVIRSPENWEKEANRCPGMNRGPLHSPEFITKASENDGTRGTVPIKHPEDPRWKFRTRSGAGSPRGCG